MVFEFDDIEQTFRKDVTSEGLMLDGQIYSVIFTLLGFLFVFRTSQSYTRYWEACTALFRIQGDWFDATSSLMAFSTMDSNLELPRKTFQKQLIRFISLINALILSELSKETSGDNSLTAAMRLPVIDSNNIDKESLLTLTEVNAKVETVFQWIQQLVVKGMRDGVIDVPAPILTRAFQELGSGMLKYHDAMKVARIKFPFPYKATSYILLALHYVLTPIVMISLTKASIWAGALTFFQIFILWQINGLANELDNPLSCSLNWIYSLDMEYMQAEHNDRLFTLVDERTLRLPLVPEDSGVRCSSYSTVTDVQGRSLATIFRVVSESEEMSISRSGRSSDPLNFWRKKPAAPVTIEPLHFNSVPIVGSPTQRSQRTVSFKSFGSLTRNESGEVLPEMLFCKTIGSWGAS